MFRVTIREIHCEEKFGKTVEVSAENATQCLVVRQLLPGRASHRRIAAEGWAKAVGIARQAFLSESRAPEKVIEMCTSARGILRSGQLHQAPQFLLDLAPENGSQWLLDNCVESWLISVEPIAVPTDAPSA